MYKLIIFIFTVIFFASCSKESVYTVNEILIPYFDAFESEASLRNLEIDLESMNILGKYEDISDANVAGQCQYYESETWLVIDPVFWQKLDSNEKEQLVFHELGHAALDRSHLDTKNNKGICNSIMRSSTDVCKSTYNDNTRTTYLDELFN